MELRSTHSVQLTLYWMFLLTAQSIGTAIHHYEIILINAFNPLIIDIKTMNHAKQSLLFKRQMQFSLVSENYTDC